MKCKLIKTEVNYYLYVDGKIIASTEYVEGKQKLFKQNCDEIFGVVDIDKFIKEASYGQTIYNESYKLGFKKAMELNKDKVFTLEELRYAFYTGMKHGSEGGIMFGKALADEYVQSIQQPTEIEVEIEMDDIWDGLDSTRIFPKEETSFPNLDPNGCLILKKI